MQAVSSEQRQNQEYGKAGERTGIVSGKGLNAAEAGRSGEEELTIFPDLVALGQLPQRQAVTFEQAAFEAAARFCQLIEDVKRELVLGGRAYLQVHNQSQLGLGPRQELLYSVDRR